MASVSSQPQFRYTQTPSKVLHLRNLPWECTEEELIELGKPFGKVVNTKCNVGANRNQAFIEFAEQNQAIAMISYYASSSEPAQVRGKTGHDMDLLELSAYGNVRIGQCSGECIMQWSLMKLNVTTCGYIVLQFYKLTPEQFSKDPFYFVLARHQNGDVAEHSKGLSVVAARVIFAVLGCLMLGTLLYTIIVDGSPFRAELYTPWVVATLIDFYINVVALAVWVAYKESSWISAILWIFLTVCFGSIITCGYIVRQLFYLSADQAVSLILFRNNNRDLKSSDPPLMVGADV